MSAPSDLAQIRLEYPDLPISEHRADILAALREHRVIVVAGETGSGKTTQLPKMLLESGARHIAHTQPRRIAARAVAERVAEEIGVELGTFVGYRFRFTDRTAPTTALTVMTDGILLASIRRDRLLKAYDAIIVDEAHERSLGIDFLLGYLAWLLPQRPDLTVVITSATLDTDRFATHFGGAPVISVAGRTYPVEVRYRPREPDVDEVQAICEALIELDAEPPGDTLVFLSGEREIRDAADAVADLGLTGTEVLTLYGRLSAAEQHRIFAPHTGRRVVLSTNVAETSLTVPGIRYVVDTGTARISRYSTRLKVQRLPIEPVSRASAQQRAGRCGRVAPGICIRLYSETDHDARPEFTEPEILRTNLASVLLQMATLRLGDIERFPFIDPPDRRSIAAGIALLEEIGAITPGAGTDLTNRVTEVGRRISRLPLDPRLGRMVLAGVAGGCVDDVIVIAAALSIRDPRERPIDQAGQADAAHARFVDPTSDLLTVLNLWRYLSERQRALSSTKFRALCRNEFLHYLRVREWQDLVTQIRSALREVDRSGRARGTRTAHADGPRDHDGSVDGDAIHRALLAGMLSHVGSYDPERRIYHGARGARFTLWPGSTLAKGSGRKAAPPAWVMAAELVETTRLWGRMAARIDPEWIEPLAAHLVRRSHSEPQWSARRGCAVAVERVTLYGIPLVTDRRIAYDRIDPEVARDFFIRHALVAGEWRTRHAELLANSALLQEARDLEERTRRDVVVDEDALTEFFAARIPTSIVSGRHFDSWWRKARRRDPDLLTLPRDLVITEAPVEEFPSEWRGYDLTYRFDPTDDRDGVSIHIPLADLPSVPEPIAPIPGLRHDVVVALLRALPKELRKRLGPAPTAAEGLLAELGGDLDSPEWRERLSRAALRIAQVDIAEDAWAWDAVPPHLRATIVVHDADGAEVAAGRDLGLLRQTLAAQAAAAVTQAVPGLVVEDLREWPTHWREEAVSTSAGREVTAFPTIVAADDGTVALRVLPTRAEQIAAMPRGVARLLVRSVPLRGNDLTLTTTQKFVLARNPHGSVAGLLEECRAAAARDLVDEVGVPRDAAGFDALVARFRREQPVRVQATLESLVDVLAAWWEATEALAGLTGQPHVTADVRRQLDGLVHPGFVLDTPADRLGDIGRYLRAITRRLSAFDAARDLLRLEQLEPFDAGYRALPPERRTSPAGVRLRWLIEEFRVSLWAQELGTREKVSPKRLAAALAAT